MSDSQHDARNLTGSADEPPSGTACPNCGSLNVEDYCASCGQRSGTLRVPVRAIVAETLLSLFAFDSRVLKTLFILIRRPGLLTRHYLDGKRARYVAPLRLYLFISFVVFLLLAVTPDPDSTQVGVGNSDSTATDTTTVQEKIVFCVLGIVCYDYSTATDTTTVQDSDDSPVSIETSESGRWFMELVQPVIEDTRWVKDRFFRQLPWAYFIVMPVFASLLRLLYYRCEPFYVPHLIFTLHAYAAGFLIFAVALGLNTLLSLNIFPEVAILGVACHLYWSLRRIYRQGRLRTLVKQCCLLLVHGLVVVIGMVIIFLYVLTTM